MADSRGGGEKGKKVLSFAAKKARRVQQKMLERVGKSEKTTDGHYTEFVVNFNKQQLAAARLQKELQKYSQNMKAMSTSTKSLLDVWMEYYEPHWGGKDEVSEIVKNKMLLWEDLMNRVNSDMVESLQLYMSKFPDAKRLAEKRERKIVDYDYSKRVLEDTRQKQKVTEVKIQQAEDTYLQAKQAFDEVTNNLYEELPALYDSRIEFYSKFFTSMTSVETKFHEEMAKLDSRYNEIMCELLQESDSGKHTSKKERVMEQDNSSANLTPLKLSDDESSSVNIETSSVNIESSSVNIEEPEVDDGEDDHCTDSLASAKGEGSGVTTPKRTSSGKESPVRIPPSKPLRSDGVSDDKRSSTAQQDDALVSDSKEPPPKPAKLPSISTETEVIEEKVTVSEDVEVTMDGDNGNDETIEKVDNPSTEPVDPPAVDSTPAADNVSAKSDEIAPDKNDDPEVLEKRIATHPYTGEDEDELSFEKGDVILVISHEPQDDEEDEGWNMGIVESTGKKGFFPENFTKLLQ